MSRQAYSLLYYLAAIGIALPGLPLSSNRRCSHPVLYAEHPHQNFPFVLAFLRIRTPAPQRHGAVLAGLPRSSSSNSPHCSLLSHAQNLPFLLVIYFMVFWQRGHG
jgi:hypothetical protein